MVSQCCLLPLNHPVGVGVDVQVQPESLLVESGHVCDSGLMAFYGYLAENTRLTQRRMLIFGNMWSLAWWNVCFKNVVQCDERLERTVEGVPGRLDSSLLLVAKAQAHSCGRVRWARRQPYQKKKEKTIRFLARIYGEGVGVHSHPLTLLEAEDWF